MRGHVFGAFRECSRDVHALLHETAAAASAREWRECGATSADAARAAYTAVLRRRWGCTVALAGARLRLSRAYLAGGADQEATAAGDAATGFDTAPEIGLRWPRRTAGSGMQDVHWSLEAS